MKTLFSYHIKKDTNNGNNCNANVLKKLQVHCQNAERNWYTNTRQIVRRSILIKFQNLLYKSLEYYQEYYQFEIHHNV